MVQKLVDLGHWDVEDWWQARLFVLPVLWFFERVLICHCVEIRSREKQTPKGPLPVSVDKESSGGFDIMLRPLYVKKISTTVTQTYAGKAIAQYLIRTTGMTKPHGVVRIRA